MPLRSGIYVVPTSRWYVERAVWLIAGFLLLASTALAVSVGPRWRLLVIATGFASIIASGLSLVHTRVHRRHLSGGRARRSTP